MLEDSRGQVAIIIPALNEEEALQCLLREIPQGVARWIIVIDNGSTDRTAEVARAAGATVVSEPQRGYGRACYKGLLTAKELGADILVFMDGDGSDDPADLQMMIEPVCMGAADLVIGSRVSERAEQGAIPPQSRLGNWLVSHMINLFYRVPIHDVGSFRAIQCSALMDLQMHEMTFGWPVEMLVKAGRARYHVVEQPIHYRKRSHGQSKVSGTVIGSIKAAYYMLSITLRYAGAQGRYGYAEAQRQHSYAGAQR